MKKIALAVLAVMMLMFAGCATNFASWKEWKADKEGPRYAASVITSEVKDGKTIGTAEIIEDCPYKGQIKKYVQTPYLKSTTPFQKGAVIWITPYDNKQ